MLIEANLTSCPDVNKQRTRPRKDDIAVINYDVLIDVRRASLALWSTSPLAQLPNL